MKAVVNASIVVLLVVSSATAQKPNDAISKQIKSLHADKQITLEFDGTSTKVMARADNFDSKETSAARIQAMNFGMAFFYPGKTLSTSADPINLTFWVLTKKPKFAGSHHWTATLDKETLDLGDARYAAKPGENMEYLNFKISRANFAKLTAASNVKFKLGNADFTFTPEQLALLRSMLAVSDSH
jgi:hypothetical protein